MRDRSFVYTGTYRSFLCNPTLEKRLGLPPSIALFKTQNLPIMATKLGNLSRVIRNRKSYRLLIDFGHTTEWYDVWAEDLTRHGIESPFMCIGCDVHVLEDVQPLDGDMFIPIVDYDNLAMLFYISDDMRYKQEMLHLYKVAIKDWMTNSLGKTAPKVEETIAPPVDLAALSEDDRPE